MTVFPRWFHRGNTVALLVDFMGLSAARVRNQHVYGVLQLERGFPDATGPENVAIGPGKIRDGWYSCPFMDASMAPQMSKAWSARSWSQNRLIHEIKCATRVEATLIAGIARLRVYVSERRTGRAA